MKIHELGHVVLYVTNIEKMANFYRDTLGFHEIDRRSGIAIFSSGRTHHELLLIEVGGVPKIHRGEPGLYHIGFKVGEIMKIFKMCITNSEKKGFTSLAREIIR